MPARSSSASGSQNHSCVHTCARNFNSERGLSRHQSACKLALATWKKEAAEAAAFREKAIRVRELKDRHGTQASSSNDIVDHDLEEVC